MYTIGHREELGAGKNWAQGRKNVGENWARERGKKVPVMSQHTESFNFIILRLLTSLNIITWLSFQRKTVSLSLGLLLTPVQIVSLHKHRVVSQSHWRSIRTTAARINVEGRVVAASCLVLSFLHSLLHGGFSDPWILILPYSWHLSVC